MSKFLSGIGRALSAPGFGDRLQAALAAAGGDTSAIQRLRALQLQQGELQRQNDARDTQVIGAKNLGFSNDEIGAMSPQDLSWAARQRIAARMFDPSGGASEGEGGYRGPTPSMDAAPQAVPGGGASYAPPPGMQLPPAFAPPPGRFSGQPGFDGAAMTAGRLPSAATHAQAASFPRGTHFMAPDGSIRRIA